MAVGYNHIFKFIERAMFWKFEFEIILSLKKYQTSECVFAEEGFSKQTKGSKVEFKKFFSC